MPTAARRPLQASRRTAGSCSRALRPRRRRSSRRRSWPPCGQLLAKDPRPQYQEDPERVYGLRFAGRNLRFRVEGATLTVLAVE